MHVSIQLSIVISRRIAPALVVGMALLMVQGCTTTPKQGYFTTPEDAVDELVRAARTGQTERLHEIFGPEADQLLGSGDPVADQQARETFLEAIDTRYRMEERENGSVVLYVGENDFLFPIPIVLGEHGWVFDTKTGLNEIINRRVGRNETYAVEVCLAIVAAEYEYLMLDPDGDGVVEYAQKFFSDPGKKNGLYWPTSEEEDPSPIGELAAQAASEGYDYQAAANPTPRVPRPFHGYRYRILTAQGPNASGGAIDYVIGERMIAGFGLVAYPAEYGNSGVMTFITNHEGVVYARDLGPQTATVAGSMTRFDPAPGWKPVADE